MDPITRTVKDLEREMRRTMGLLRRLRDEIRLELHLAGMEAKDRWAELQARIDETERLTRQVSDPSLKAIRETLEAVKAFRSWLREQISGSSTSAPRA